MNNDKQQAVSYYNSVTDKSATVVNIEDVFNTIRKCSYRELINKIRATPDKTLKNRLKQNLPAIMVSGLTTGSHKVDEIKQHTGLIQIDFDGVADLQELKQQINNDIYTYCSFISPG